MGSAPYYFRLFVASVFLVGYQTHMAQQGKAISNPISTALSVITTPLGIWRGNWLIAFGSLKKLLKSIE